MKVLGELKTIEEVRHVARLGYGSPNSYFATPIVRRGRKIPAWNLAKNGRGYVITAALMHKLSKGGYMKGWHWSSWTHRFFHRTRNCRCGMVGEWAELRRRENVRKATEAAAESRRRVQELNREIIHLESRLRDLRMQQRAA